MTAVAKIHPRRGARQPQLTPAPASTDWEPAEISAATPAGAGWEDAEVVSTLPDGREMNLEQLVDIAMRGSPDPRWHASQSERSIARSEMFRKISTGRNSGVPEDLCHRGSITSEQLDAARMFSMDFALANESQIKALDFAVQRLDGGDLNPSDARIARRIDAQNRLEAARAYLAEETALDLDRVVMSVVIQNMAPHVLFGGRPTAPGEKRKVNASKSAKGVAAVQLALHRLVTFYGLAEKKRRQKKSATRSNSLQGFKAA